MNTKAKRRHSRGDSSARRDNNFSQPKTRYGKFRYSGFKSTGAYRPKRNNFKGGGNRGGGRKMPTFDPSQFINTRPTQTKTETYTPRHSFDTLGLSVKILRNIKSLGIHTPTPIQDKIIPEILNGHDVIGLAETGTGKTAAFLIPLIEKTEKDSFRQTLILTPTRELALQIEEEFKKLSKGMKIFSITCVGGTNIQPQIRALRRKNHFIVGTPGRTLDLMNRKSFDGKTVTTVVLDEADRMLDMGFFNDIKKILKNTPSARETLLFSATIAPNTKQLADEFLKNPIMISVKKDDVLRSIEQNIITHSHHDKLETLIDLLKNEELKKVLIFGAMRHGVNKLAKELNHYGIKSESIHGNKNQAQRVMS